MNPPPPILPQQGSTTASAYPTATAASTALPPSERMRTPTSEARRCADTTIPCSASTASGAAARASPISAAEKASAATTARASVAAGRNGLANRLVEPLVIEGAFERVQFLAELLGVRGRDAGIEGLAVAPTLEQGEMVRAVVLLQYVEPQVAVILSRGRRQRFLKLDSLILLRRRDIDMGENEYRLRPRLRGRRRDREAAEK